MSSCSAPVTLCPFHRGDTIPFDFEFKNADGSPMDISGMVLFFSMKLDIQSETLGANDLQTDTTFPADLDSESGLGSMKVLPVDTDNLLPERTYSYDFQLVNGAEDVFTVGYGMVDTLRDVTRVTA